MSQTDVSNNVYPLQDEGINKKNKLTNLKRLKNSVIEHSVEKIGRTFLWTLYENVDYNGISLNLTCMLTYVIYIYKITALYFNYIEDI